MGTTRLCTKCGRDCGSIVVCPACGGNTFPGSTTFPPERKCIKCGRDCGPAVVCPACGGNTVPHIK